MSSPATGPAPAEDGWVQAAVRGAASVFEPLGHVTLPGGPLIPPGDDSTLYTTAGIQHWRPWVLASDPGSEPGRLGAQWCVRMNNAHRVGSSNFLTSFCMLSVLTRGRVEREAALGRMFEVLGRWGIDVGRVAFVATGEGPLAPEDTASLRALEQLGVPAERRPARPRAWAAPFKPHGPTGPELFVLLDVTGTPCGPACGPLCGCGRHLHFWNLEFLENRRLPGGGTETLDVPFLDSAGSIEWVTGAVHGTPDPYRGPPFAPLLGRLRELLAGAPRPFADGQVRLLADHARTIALILAAGVEPAATRHGHVLRRLVRRSLGVLTAGGAGTGVLARAVEAAQGEYRSVPGFGAPPPRGGEILASEARRFEEGVAAARRAYDRLVAAGGVSADAVFRLHSSHGLPWEVADGWLADDGVAVDGTRLAALRAEHTALSRGG